MSDLHIVDGPPGCGKTTYLSRQAQRAADTHGAQSVIIASLTRTAAHEIASRTPAIPATNVGTLHAHAWRALNRPALAETAEGLAAWNEQHPSMRLRPTGSIEGDGDPGSAGNAADLHARVGVRRARMDPPHMWTAEELDHHAAWTDYKTQTHTLDFTDLIERAAQLEQHPARPAVMLLDEAQDFSRLELHLALRWAAATKTTVIVGDERQTIYSWRGADPRALSAIAAQRHALRQSHRLPRAVHAAAQQWATLLDDGPADYQPTDRQGSAGHLHARLTNPTAIVRAAQHAADQGQSVMILATCGYMLTPLLASLREHAVPFHNPHRPDQGAWNPLRGARRLAAFLGERWTWDDVAAWTEPLTAAGVLQRGARGFIDTKRKPDRFGESQAHERAPLDTLAQIIEPGALHAALARDVQWWASRLRSARKRQMTYPLAVHAAHGAGALRATPKITVGTVHSVKGGEADLVMVAPDLSKEAYWHGWRTRGEARQQLVRLGYVARTRARQACVTLDPSTSEHWNWR